ncbi:MAG TPA: hypothetical protein VFQ39_16965, partial [Longimicrobium sp.]|nr:hypothetical protein [Longimicrobium sp.]
MFNHLFRYRARGSRSHALRLAAAGALAFALAAPAFAQPRGLVSQRPTFSAGGRVKNIPRGPLLGQPVVVRPVDNVLDAELTVVDTTLNVPAVGNVPLRAYMLTAVNGRPVANPTPSFPGPTFRFSPGDSIRIRLVNRLPNQGDNATC